MKVLIACQYKKNVIPQDSDLVVFCDACNGNSIFVLLSAIFKEYSNSDVSIFGCEKCFGLLSLGLSDENDKIIDLIKKRDPKKLVEEINY
ncbi:hypothetical protein [Methanocaldococcus sp.]